MNKFWAKRLQQHQEMMDKKKHSWLKKIITYSAILSIIFLFFYPQYIKRAIYPYLLGKPTNEPMKISTQDYYEDVSGEPITFERKGFKYTLIPKVYYKATGKIGIVDNYDTLFYRIYRGFLQKDYIALVPRDIMFVIGNMAMPENFKLFEFKHEERGGFVLCKGVKYRTSFLSSFTIMSEKQYLKSEENYNHCAPLIKEEEYNNYHPIPASEIINKALSMLLPEDIVTLEGFLVDVPELELYTGTRKGQIHKDIKAGGMDAGKCFIIYTTKIIINGRSYE